MADPPVPTDDRVEARMVGRRQQFQMVGAHAELVPASVMDLVALGNGAGCLLECKPVCIDLSAVSDDAAIAAASVGTLPEPTALGLLDPIPERLLFFGITALLLLLGCHHLSSAAPHRAERTRLLSGAATLPSV
jgi:hypothetical protein